VDLQDERVVEHNFFMQNSHLKMHILQPFVQPDSIKDTIASNLLMASNLATGTKVSS